MDETRGVSARSGAQEQTLDAVVEGWSRLLASFVVVIMAGFAVMMPFPGLAFALAAASYLRAADVHARRHPGGMLRLLAGPLAVPLDLLRGIAGTLVTVPYAAAVAVLLPLLIMAASALDVRVHPLVGAAWGAGAAAFALLAAPGVRAPRRQLVRVFRGLVPEPRRIAAAAVLLCAVTVAVLAGAVAGRPSFTPMYALQNAIAQQLTIFQDSVYQRVR